MVAAMKKLIAQVEALSEEEQAEVAELLLAELERRAGGSGPDVSADVTPKVQAVIDDVARRHSSALSKLA